ncbi:MAG: LexA family protein [Desulfomonilaceae bacterium]
MELRDDPRESKMLGRIAGSPLIESTEDRETIPISAGLLRKNNIHVLQVKGDSMIGDYVLDGDHVIVESRTAARDGELVVALMRNCETTLKRFLRDGHQIRLEQTDTSDEAMVFDEEDVVVQGVVVGILRKYRG